MVHIRVNAGFLPAEHWTQQPGEGGRVVGEVCHFVDWARYVIGHPVRFISVAALPNRSRYNRDNVAATLTFADGSIANLLYLANGDPAVPKEYFEVFCEGAVARLEDFVSLELVRNRKTKRHRFIRDKGHKEEVRLTVEAMISRASAPIPVAEIFEVTETTFAIVESLVGPAEPTHGALAPLAVAGS